MRLRKSVLTSPGLRRVRRGRGFSYVDAGGHAVDAESRERVRALVIPPAWIDVWISPDPKGHIQAVGTDDAGRRQYLYHEAWHVSRGRLKHDRVRQLAPRLGEVRREVGSDLRAGGLGRDRVIAVALRMLDLGLFRTGGEEYAVQNGSHGVATLRRTHVTVRGDEVDFVFPAKSGQRREATVRDPGLAKAVAGLKRSSAPGRRLLRYSADGSWHDVSAADVNETFKRLAGDEYTVKDLRTWAATVLAAGALAELDSQLDDPKRVEREAISLIAEHLGNTPAVARRSYVDPVVLDEHAAGRTVATVGRHWGRVSAADRRRLVGGEPLTARGRATLERAVLRLLSDARS